MSNFGDRFVNNKAAIRPTGTRRFHASGNQIPILGAAIVQFWVHGRLFQVGAIVSKHITEAILGCNWLRDMNAIVHFCLAQMRLVDLTILFPTPKCGLGSAGYTLNEALDPSVLEATGGPLSEPVMENGVDSDNSSRV